MMVQASVTYATARFANAGRSVDDLIRISIPQGSIELLAGFDNSQIAAKSNSETVFRRSLAGYFGISFVGAILTSVGIFSAFPLSIGAGLALIYISMGVLLATVYGYGFLVGREVIPSRYAVAGILVAAGLALTAIVSGVERFMSV